MNQLSLTLFGGFAVETDAGIAPHFTTDKVRALLVYLALKADTPLRREALAGIFWPDQPESLARQNLRQTLSRLRKSLDEAAPELGDALLTVDRQTVTLQGGNCSTDIALYLEHVQAVDAHRHSDLSDCSRCLVRLEAAVGLYRRGEFLVGLSLPNAQPFEEWLLLQREHVYRRQLTILGDLTSAYEKQGAFEAAYRNAMWQLEIEPWREEAHRQAMRLLASNGQRGEALAQYESCRQVLADELGVEPAEETTRLWRQIRDETLQPLKERRTQTHHFPSQLTPFVGREKTLSEIFALLADENCRVLSLIGLGGMGKTRLSIRVGRERVESGASGRLPAIGAPYYRDGAYFVPLATVIDSELLVTAIAQRLQLTLDEDVLPRRQLISYLQDKNLLLVCDNFEQIVDGASLVAEIVAAAPGVQVLLTSQQPLNIQAECRYNVDGLDYTANDETSEAVQLFVRSARRVMPDFRLAPDDLAAVLALCQLLDGMPLALEIAAGWVRMMNCQTILQETKKSLDFLVSPLSDAPSRHQSVRAVVTRSWQSLPTRLQGALRQIALFSGGFTLEAARAIMPDVSMVDMASLMDQSLVSWRSDSRYEMHSLLSHFTRLQVQPLEGQDEEERFRGRYCRYYLSLIVEWVPQLQGPNPRQAIENIQRDLDNIRQAWQWGLEDQMASSLADSLSGLGRFYQLVGLFEEAEQRFLAALSQIIAWEQVADRDLLRLNLHIQASHFLGQSGQYRGALEHAYNAQELARQLDESDLLAQALGLEGEWRRQLNQLDLAKSRLEAAAALFPTPSRNRGYARVLDEIGQLHLIQSQYDAALSSLNQARQIYEAVGDQIEMSTTLANLAEVFRQKADYTQGMVYCRQALTVAEAIGYKQAIVRISIVLGTIQLEQGDIEVARTTFQNALQIARTLGYMRGIINCQTFLGVTYATQGRLDEAGQWYQVAARQAEEVGLQDLIAQVMGRQGILYSHQGEHEAAITVYRQAAQLWRLLNNQAELSRNLNNLGNIYLRLGQYDQALDYFEQALAAVQAVGARQAVANSMLRLGNVYKRTGNYKRAISYFEQSLEIHRTLQHKGGMATCLGWLGLMHFEQGQFEAAWERYDQAMSLSQEMDDHINLTVWLMNKAEVAMHQGKRERAERLAQQAVDLARTLGSSRYLPAALIHQAEVFFTFGQYERARLLLLEALPLGKTMGDQHMFFGGCLLQARLLARLGEQQEAIDQIQAMIAQFPGDDYQAQSHYYLWEIDGDNAARQTAARLYEKLLARTPNYRLQQQWDRLHDA